MGTIAEVAPYAREPFELRVSIGLGELGVTGAPVSEISSFGLGSCVAVAMYDRRARIGGLVHSFLPDGTETRHRPRARQSPCLFVNLGLEQLVEELRAAGATVPTLTAWIVGGADATCEPGELVGLGRENVAMAHSILAHLGVWVAAEDIGGHVVRSVHLRTQSGKLLVKAQGVMLEPW